jgi:hypothetical protein
MKSPGKSVLTLTNIQTDQGGVYECSAMNAAVDSMGNVIKPSPQSVQVNVVCEYCTYICSRYFKLWK